MVSFNFSLGKPYPDNTKPQSWTHTWVVPPCSLQFFLPISLIEALCRCFVFSKVVGQQPFKKKHLKDSKKTAGCNNHKQPSAWNHSPPATTHWLKGTTPKRPSHVPPVTRRVSVSPWWRALWRRGQRLGRWRPMKTGDFIRKTMGFTLWLCQQLAIEVMAQSK